MSETKAVAKAADVRGYLTLPSTKDQIARALPSHMTADRMLRVASTALLRSPKLMTCTVESFAKALLDCSALGLEPDGRRAHLIPYGDACTLIVDYKGLIELARRHGDVALWRPVSVKANDKFSWRNGIIDHEINWMADRGELVCVYSHVRFKDGTDDYEVMTLAECNAIRKRSRSGGAGPWVTDFEAMCLKSCIRKHSKRMVLSSEFREALDRDGDTFEPIAADVIEVSKSPLAAARDAKLKTEATAEETNKENSNAS